MCNFYFHITHTLHEQERAGPFSHQLHCLFAFLLCQLLPSHLSTVPTHRGACLLEGRVLGAGNGFYMLLQRPISMTSTLRAAAFIGLPVWLEEVKGGRVSMTRSPIYHLLTGKMLGGAKDTMSSIKQDPSFSSNFMYLSEPWLPYQLNQYPTTLHHKAGARLHPSTHIYWAPQMKQCVW